MNPNKVYTVGTNNRTFEAFWELLHLHRIVLICDVRRFPTSQLEHFKQPILAERMAASGVDYIWLGDSLGGFRRGGYGAHTKTELFREGIKQLKELARVKTTAFICREKFPWKCHRRFIAHALEDAGFCVIHIIERDKVWIPSKARRSIPGLRV